MGHPWATIQRIVHFRAKGAETVAALDRIAALGDRPREAELNPPLPIAVRTHPEHVVDVLVLEPFEIGAHVEPGQVQSAPFKRRQGQQEPADTSIAISERMDRLELIMNEV